MKFDSPSHIRALLAELDFAPSKVLGQNFLIDGNIRDIIVDTAEVDAGEHVIEIGPGLGMLTQGLLKKGVRVTAVEKDEALVAHLGRAFATELAQGLLRLIHADALKVNFPDLLAGGARKVISNLPYSVGNRILVDLVLADDIPDLITIMVQRDVAERIAAQPNCREYGVLSVLLQLRCDVETVKQVSPRCFVPAPRVWSTVLRLRRNDANGEALRNRQHFVALVKYCFSQRRKQLQGILRKAPAYVAGQNSESALAAIGIEGERRPENVPVAQWVELSNRLST